MTMEAGRLHSYQVRLDGTLPVYLIEDGQFWQWVPLDVCCASWEVDPQRMQGLVKRLGLGEKLRTFAVEHVGLPVDMEALPIYEFVYKVLRADELQVGTDEPLKRAAWLELRDELMFLELQRRGFAAGTREVPTEIAQPEKAEAS